MSPILTTELSPEKISRADLIAAFNAVVAASGRRRVIDLHVRKLLLYVRAVDHEGRGVQRSLQRLADRLLLPVATCRRVIRRAAKHFGLLTVTHQRHVPGGQTVNRYSINCPSASRTCNSAITQLTASHPENTNTPALSEHAPGSTDVPVGSSVLPNSLNSYSPQPVFGVPALSDHAPLPLLSTDSILLSRRFAGPPATSDHALRQGSDSS